MIVVLMGVSGSGKTTVGEILALRLRWRYLDADAFHPPENVEKMRSGVPLTDADRWPWLDRMNRILREHEAGGDDVVLGCSALRQIYRERLAQGLRDLRWVHLKGSFELIQSRLAVRKHRYMPATLLRSQFDTLEAPTDALDVDIADPPEQLAQRIAEALAVPRGKT
jgi:gluconokinase